MDRIREHHLERLKAATVGKLSNDQIPEWLIKNTSISGMPFSFKDHEYQERILRETSPEVVIRKPSQVGMSETSCRFALALAGMTPFYTVIYTLPTATFAGVFMSTRVNAVIQGSPFLKGMLDKSTDNNEVKQLGSSYLYLKGAASNNAAISVPANALIFDEVDFSDQTILTQYYSRVRHAQNPKIWKLSTPTRPGFGIDKSFSDSRRFFNLVKCSCCGNYFTPDFYEHVRIPHFTGDIKELNANNLHTVAWRDAFVECPRCKGLPSLQPEYREWVCENPSDSHVATGFQISPFDAPNIMTVSRLVQESTRYSKITDFHNFGLGMPAEDKESTITRQELEAMMIDNSGMGGITVMGMDMGHVCHAVVMAIAPDSTRVIVHTEKIPVANVRARRRELARQYRVRMTVVDALPYTETVLNMQQETNNLYGAYYVSNKSLETHRVVDKDEDTSSAALGLKQVNINKNQAFDVLMSDIRLGFMKKMRDSNDAEWISHMQDMKRVQQFNNESQLVYVWQKSDQGQDHFHHATLYASIASQMLGAARNVVNVPLLPRKMRLKTGV